MDNFDKLKALVEAHGVKIVHKKDSKFMRFLAGFLPFAENFMADFSTTIGSTIYLAERHWGNVEVLAHEYTHAYDAKRVGTVVYSLRYLFPQCLSLLSLLSLVVVASPWWPSAFYFIVAIVFLGCLAPLPAPWRVEYEFRGYKMSLLVLARLYGQVPEGWALRQFFAPSYSYGNADVVDDFNKLFVELVEGRVVGQPFEMVLSVLEGKD